MAHHISTPASVLNAPSRKVTATHIPEGATRAERRHGIQSPASLNVIQLALYRRRIMTLNNRPAVRAETDTLIEIAELERELTPMARVRDRIKKSARGAR